MEARIGIWGGSCAIRIPKLAAERLGLREGEQVRVDVEDGALVIRPTSPHYELAALVREARELNAPEPLDDGAWGGEAL